MTKAVVSARVLAKCVKLGRLEMHEREYFRLMGKYYSIFNALYTLRTKYVNLAAFIGKFGVFTQLLKLLSWMAERDMRKL